MSKYIKKAFFILLLSIIFTIITSGSVAALPIIIKDFIAQIPKGLNFDIIIYYCSLFLGAIAIILISEYANKIVNIKYKECIMLNLKQDLFEKIIEFNYVEYHEQDTDFYLSLFTEDVNLLFSDYFEAVSDLLKTIISIIVYSLIMLFLNPIMAMVIIILSLGGLIIPKLSGTKLAKKRAKQSQANQEQRKIERHNIRYRCCSR